MADAYLRFCIRIVEVIAAGTAMITSAAMQNVANVMQHATGGGDSDSD